MVPVPEFVIVPELVIVPEFVIVPKPEFVIVPLLVIIALLEKFEFRMKRVSPLLITKFRMLTRVPLKLTMEQVPVLPAFHVPPKDLQRVPFRDGVEPGLPALADGASVTRSRSDKTPITLFNLLTLNINNILAGRKPLSPGENPLLSGHRQTRGRGAPNWI